MIQSRYAVRDALKEIRRTIRGAPNLGLHWTRRSASVYISNVTRAALVRPDGTTLRPMSTSTPSRILLKVAGSLMAALAGILAGFIAMLLFGWEDWSACLTLIGFFAVPAWALVLLPLHVLLPRSSPFWYPSASAGSGGAVGAVL